MRTFLSLPPAQARVIRSRLFVSLIFIAMLVAVAPELKTEAAASPTATVTVSSSATGTMQTQMSTNNVWSGAIDQTPNAQQELNALHDPLVRLHVGDDGYPVAMPDVKYNQWSFSALDALVNDVTRTGKQPLMNIKFAPDWMWTCTTYQAPGTVKDLTFQTFAQYMARLVSYYNLGSMTTETGQVITNPAGTANRVTNWELWNEPDLNNETPCAPSDGFGITPAQYVTMWNAVTKAMLAVDPTLKFVGPATSGGQFGSTSYNEYITQLMSGATVQPWAISFHGYGYWDNTVTDKTIFDGDATGAGGISGIVSDVRAIRGLYPQMPLWLTEVNVNADWGNDSHQRPWNAYSAAWWGALFSQVAPLGVALINQYDVIDGPQFGLIDDQTGATRLPYWEQQVINSAFPPGSTLLSSSSSNGQVLSLAVERPDGLYSVLVVNRQVDSSTVVGGTGLPATVAVNLQGINPSAITLQQIDATTNPATEPTVLSETVSTSPQITFGGYGMAVLTITDPPSSTSTPTASPTPTASVAPTSTATATTTATATSVSTHTPTPTPTHAPMATATPKPTPTATSTSSSMVLYDNKVESPWTDASFAYSIKNAQDGMLYYSAPYSYAITYAAWGALNFQLPSGTISTAAYRTLQYKLYPNGQPISDFGALMTDSAGNVINEIVLSSSMVTSLRNNWYQVSIPVSQLNPSSVSIQEVQFKNERATTLRTVHYDDVYLKS